MPVSCTEGRRDPEPRISAPVRASPTPSSAATAASSSPAAFAVGRDGGASAADTPAFTGGAAPAPVSPDIDSPAGAGPFDTASAAEAPGAPAGGAFAAGATGVTVVEMIRRPGNTPAAATPRGLLDDGDSRPADRASARSCCSRRLFSEAAAPSFALRGCLNVSLTPRPGMSQGVHRHFKPRKHGSPGSAQPHTSLSASQWVSDQNKR